MLSVAPADVTALVANQTYGSVQQTNTAHSIASDNAGDFVVTWTRQDDVLDSNGNPITNPATDEPETVSDVYARYFTQTVQQVTLPTGTARFSLTDNDQTIDEISVTTGTAPAGAGTGTTGETTVTSEAGDTTNPISGTFNLWYNATGNDTLGQQDTAALPAIQYLAASSGLPLTFANSVTGSAVNQKLTFSTTQNAPISGDINLQVGSTPLGPVFFDNASLTTLGTTATAIETALQDFGYNATVTLDPSSTTASAVFDVTYTATQSDELTVTYDSTDAAAAATQIQTWLNGFAPVTGVSDATHAIVNAIDPNDFVVDFGAATQGLNQSTLLQYLSTESAYPRAADADLRFDCQLYLHAVQPARPPRSSRLLYVQPDHGLDRASGRNRYDGADRLQRHPQHHRRHHRQVGALGDCHGIGHAKRPGRGACHLRCRRDRYRDRSDYCARGNSGSGDSGWHNIRSRGSGRAVADRHIQRDFLRPGTGRPVHLSRKCRQPYYGVVQLSGQLYQFGRYVDIVVDRDSHNESDHVGGLFAVGADHHAGPAVHRQQHPRFLD